MPKYSRTSTGSQAISSMVRRGTNQAFSAVKQRYSGKKAPSNLANDMKILMSLMNTEDKQIYTLATLQGVNSTGGLVYGIGTVAQGSASNQRTGDSIKINRIQLNLQFLFTTGTVATTAIVNQVFNYYLVRYLKTPSSSGTSAFNISEFLNVDANGQYTPASFPNPDTNQNFQVMASGQAKLQLPYGTSVPSTVDTIVEIDHMCSFHQDYSGSANSTITDNMCFLVFTGLNGVNTGGSSGVVVNAAMWYIDN